MSEPDPKTTLREFKEYLDLSYESPREFAARICVTKETIWYWLSGRRQPKAPSLLLNGLTNALSLSVEKFARPR
jgi:DNA-binding transcriptional regulator YiaG